VVLVEPQGTAESFCIESTHLVNQNHLNGGLDTKVSDCMAQVIPSVGEGFALIGVGSRNVGDQSAGVLSPDCVARG
jgi:hypothetical protein